MAKADTDVPTVSIVSLLSDRRHFIPLLKACVEAQTYPSRKIEWIIVDDGPEDEGAKFGSSSQVYFHGNKKLALGRKRQIACDMATGEFLFFFDDDDLHYPHRIERSVEKLQKFGSKMIAGNSAMLVADAITEDVIQSGPFNKNHATAGTFAFRREYLKHSSFRLSDTAGEEVHFLKNWSIPMVQLHPQETIIALAHSANTVSKDKLLEDSEVKGSLEKLFGKPKILQIMRDCLTQN